MRRFAAAWKAAIETPKSAAAEEALTGYLRAAASEDAAWAVWFLAGRGLKVATSAELRSWAIEESGLPEWLFDRSRDTVGNVPETVAHLLAGGRAASDWPLHRLVAERLAPLARRGADRRDLVVSTWRELGADELDVWNRLLLGALRPRPAAGILARAVAAATGGHARQVEARLESDWTPSPGALERMALPGSDTGGTAPLFGERGPGTTGGRGAAEPAATAEAAAASDARAAAPAGFAFGAVLLYAQRSDGGRGNLYSDLTLGAWEGGELVPVAKVAGGLGAAEALELDRWVRRNAVDKFGPVRHVRPELVFEVACEAVLPSARHKAGLTLRGARLVRWRRDLRAADGVALAVLRDRVDGGGGAAPG